LSFVYGVGASANEWLTLFVGVQRPANPKGQIPLKKVNNMRRQRRESSAAPTPLGELFMIKRPAQ